MPAASALVLIEQQVGDALGDWEAAAGLGADQRALLKHHLQQRVVERAQELLVLQRRLVRRLWQAARACAAARMVTTRMLQGQGCATACVSH